MSVKKRLLHFAAVTARVLHLWPAINRTGIFYRARRRKYPDMIVHLDVVVTECCSLKCRDCSNFMQYYRHPENLDTGEIIDSLRVLFRAVRVHELKLLGGEPFVNQKALTEILDYLKNEAVNSYDEIRIITNGTVVPNAELVRVMKDTPRLTVLISNYGELSQKINEITSICENEKIACILNPEDEYWWDYGKPVRYNATDRQTQSKFAGCYARRLCTSLYRGKLYVCPRQAHGIHLGMFPEVKEECLPLDGSKLSSTELRDAVYALTDRKDFISACRYCIDGKLVKIPKAIQVSEPLDYE